MRSRPLYALLLVAVVAASFLWRAGVIPMPTWLSNFGVGALSALMVFVGFGFLFIRVSTLTLSLLALATSWGVEVSQLYLAPWLEAVRGAQPGWWVPHTTFNWHDLPAYAVGVVVGSLMEWRWRVARRD